MKPQKNPNLGGRRKGAGRKAATKEGKRDKATGLRFTQEGIDALNQLSSMTGLSKNEITERLVLREFEAERKHQDR